MKKIISLLLVLVLLTSVVAGCSKPAADTDPSQVQDKTPEVETTPEDDDKEVVEAGEVAKLGLGQNISIGSSKDADEDKPATAQADVTMAAVGFDAEGKVVSVTIDTVQSKVDVDKEGKIVSDISGEVKTKHVLKEDYGMKPVSEKIGIGKEWYEQMEAFQEWMIGKTADEIKNLQVKEKDEDHLAVPDVPELTSSVTMTVEDYIAAVVEAWDNAIDVENGATVGLGSLTALNSSKEAEEDKPAIAQADTTMTATAFDAEGNVVGTIIDVVQVKVEIKDGEIISDKSAEIKTKHELKEDYGMKPVSEKIGIGKEWYEQAEALQEWMVGKSVSEIAGLPVVEKDEDHLAIPDVPELTSSVTMTVEDYLEVVQRALDNAK